MRQLVTLVIFIALTAAAAISVSDVEELTSIKPETQQTKLYREIVNKLATKHYLTQPIDDKLSESYLNTYIERLDPLKRYFLISDIDEFNQWQHKLDDLAKRGDVKAGFYIFNRLRERATERLKANIALLEDKEYSFDFTIDESITLDPDNRHWFLSSEDADIFWAKALKDSMIRLILNGKKQQQAQELLIKRYKTQLTQYIQRDSQDAFQMYVNALASLYDPHTFYFSPRTTENFYISMSLSLEGIGAELTTEDEYTEVVRVIPGGPADLQGTLKPKDRIIGVGQGKKEIVDVVGWRIDDVVALIRGEKGSVVRLEVSSAANNPKIISIVRDRVKLEEKSVQSKILDIQSNDTDYKLGVIEIPSFYTDFQAYQNRDPNFTSSSRDVHRILQELKKQNVDGIILDLRNNGGGSLFEATALTDLFIDRGPVVQIRDADKRIYGNQRAISEAVYSGPLVVLINRLSASASEIFAGAMQDYGRALVVGGRSYGKGTVQNITGLISGQLKLTISKFYRISGDSTQHRGIIPDIVFPAVYDSEEVGESQLDNALPWDQIRAVPHQRSKQLKAFLKPLVSEHKKRAYNDPNFTSMVDQLALTQNWSKETSLSLNLETRRAKNETLDSKLLNIENKRRATQGFKPHPNMAAWEEEKDEEDMKDRPVAESDPILNETAYILSNQIKLLLDSQLTENNARIARLQSTP